MSTYIITKHSGTTSNEPSVLLAGELAVNYTDKKLWVGNSSNSPVVISDTQSSGNNTWTGTQTFTGLNTFNGTTSNLAAKFTNILEKSTVSATAATGTINYDLTTQTVLYYTSNAAANWTLNFRASSGTSLNTAMSTGDNITAVFLVTQGSTAYINSAITIDGNSVTPKWQGGNSPLNINTNSVDAYVYTIIKTGSATFSVFASQTKFA